MRTIFAPSGDRLLEPGVVITDFGVDDLSRQQLDFSNVRVRGQFTRQLQHVFDLSTGIRVAPNSQLFGSNQPMQTDQRDFQRSFFDRPGRLAPLT